MRAARRLRLTALPDRAVRDTTRPAPSVVRRAAVAQLLRSAARLDRTQSDPVVAARNAVGVTVPLALGALAGSAASGLPATIGALQTAFADRPGPYRLRMLRMLGTALAVAVTGSLAVAVSGSTLASAALLLVVGATGGLLLAAGPSATQVGVAATAAAVILGHQAQRPGLALHIGLLVAAGGVGQTLLAVAAWPLRRHLPERRALAELYRDLAALARRPPGPHAGPPLGERLAEVRLTLYGLGHDHGASVEAYRVLLDEAERIRRELLVLGDYAARLAGPHPRAAAGLRSVLQDAGTLLAEVAAALAAARDLDETQLDPLRRRVQQTLAILTDPDLGEDLTVRAAAARLRSLTGQLRAVLESTRIGATEGRHRAGPDPVRAAARLGVPLAVLRAHLTPGSAVLRHALRLGVLVSLSDLLVRSAGVPRGYWIPLTIAVVLRPDFGSTLQRSALRVAGTIIGLLTATVLVHWVPGGPWYAVALVGVFLFAMRLAGPGNFGLSAAALGALVVVLLSLAGVSPHQTVLRRGVDTLIGGALALAASLVWPVWERTQVAARLAELLGAYRGYTAAVADLRWDQDRMHRARSAGRLARTNAQASVDRARSEPVAARPQVELGDAVLAHTHRFVRAMLTIDAMRPALRQSGAPPLLAQLMHQVEQALGRCEQAVRSGTAPRATAALREAQAELSTALLRDPGPSVETAGALIEATDRIADSLDTLISELRRQLPALRQA